MRVVLDTNTVVSGLLWQGAPRRLLERADDAGLILYSSAPLIAELYRVLTYPRVAPRLAAVGADPAALVTLYAHRVVVVEPANIPPAIAADPDDDAVLACALAAQADVIVSGDSHVLALGEFRDIPSQNVTALLERLGL